MTKKNELSDLSKTEVALMNEAKHLSDMARELIKKLEHERARKSLTPAEGEESRKCITTARVHLETGLMWASRAIALT